MLSKWKSFDGKWNNEVCEQNVDKKIDEIAIWYKLKHFLVYRRDGQNGRDIFSA